MERTTLQPLKWLEILEIGVPEIDTDHRDLLQECNDLTAMIGNDGGWLEIAAAARQMFEHCLAHFRLEEEFLTRSKFPRLESHLNEHSRIARKLEQLVAALEQAGASEAEKLRSLEALRAILIDILLRHDLDYKSHLLAAQGR